MKIKGVNCLFGKETEAMKFDVLQAILNLERTNDPNFMKIKEWLQREHEGIVSQTAYSVGLNSDMSNAFKGMATVLGSLCFFFQEPKLAMVQIQQQKAAQKQQQQVTRPGNIP
jgi:hypothetical protein